MSNTTSNLGLYKPQMIDYPSTTIPQLASNFDTIDSSLAEIATNVITFGADPTGQKESSAAIQAAHDSLPSNGGKIIVPQGKYLVRSTINFTKPILLEGQGSGDHTAGVGVSNTGTSYAPTSQGSVIFTDSPTIDVINVNASGFSIRDIAIVNTSPSPTSGNGLRIQRGDGAHLTRVRTAGFWNNVSFEESEYATITDCLFIDPVNYGLWLRNLVIPDQGDMSLMGCAFSYSGSVNRTGATAIRWESGGGLKMTTTKINMGPRGGIGKFDYGLYLAVADGVGTSVFTVTGCSFENLAHNGILARPQGTGGEIGKITVTGNEFAYCNDCAIAIEGSSSITTKRVAIGNNVIDSTNTGIYLHYVDGAVISPNNIEPNSGGWAGVAIDVGCQNIMVGRQMMKGYSNSLLLFQNLSPTTFSNPNGTVEIDYHDKRSLPSTITSTSNYTSLWTVNVPQFASGVIDITVNAIVEGKAPSAIKLSRLFTRNDNSTAVVLTTIGTDTTSGPTFDISLDTTTTVGSVIVKVKLNPTTGGTQLDGSATIDIHGDISGMLRNA